MAAATTSRSQHLSELLDAPLNVVIAVVFLAVVIAITLNFAFQLLVGKTDQPTRAQRPQASSSHWRDPPR